MVYLWYISYGIFFMVYFGVQELGDVSLARIWQDNCTRRALILGSLLQMFQQLAGVNTVMWVQQLISL